MSWTDEPTAEQLLDFAVYDDAPPCGHWMPVFDLNMDLV